MCGESYTVGPQTYMLMFLGLSPLPLTSSSFCVSVLYILTVKPLLPLLRLLLPNIKDSYRTRYRSSQFPPLHSDPSPVPFMSCCRGWRGRLGGGHGGSGGREYSQTGTAESNACRNSHSAHSFMPVSSSIKKAGRQDFWSEIRKACWRAQITPVYHPYTLEWHLKPLYCFDVMLWDIQMNYVAGPGRCAYQ